MSGNAFVLPCFLFVCPPRTPIIRCGVFHFRSQMPGSIEPFRGALIAFILCINKSGNKIPFGNLPNQEAPHFVIPTPRIGTDTLYLQAAITRSPNLVLLSHLNHSVRNAGSNGERTTALTATSEAANPVNATASNNSPSDAADNRPPRAISAGMIARSAHKTPVNNPQPSSRAFSAITIRDRCDG